MLFVFPLSFHLDRQVETILPFDTLLTEKEALTFPPCKDLGDVADVSKSVVEVLGKLQLFQRLSPIVHWSVFFLL